MLLPGANLAHAADRPPNFIIILTDDQGCRDLGCFGAPDIKTPQIDRMAAEGMRLPDCHTASPVCTPSRAALMTGCYLHYSSRGALDAIRQGQWKLRIDGEKVELYDLDSDLGETADVAARQPEVVERLKAMMGKMDVEIAANARPVGKSEEGKP